MVAALLLASSAARAAEDGNTAVKQALDLMDGDNPRQAVALLADAARTYPQNRNVGSLLYTLLRDKSWPVPQTLPVKMSAEITAIAFNSDGLQLIVGAADGTVRILDGETGEFTNVTVKHPEAVIGLKMGPKDECAFSVSRDGLAEIWEPKTGKVLQKWSNRGHKLTASAATLDLSLVALGYEDGQVVIYSRKTGAALGQPIKHDQAIRDLAFSRDDTALATASVDGTARVWDVATLKARDFVVKHKAPLTDVDLGQLGILLLTASEDGITKVSDAHTGKALVPEIDCGSPIIHASFGTSGIRVSTVLADHTVRLWDTATGQALEGVIRTDEGIANAVWGPGGLRIFTGSDATKAAIWSLNGARVCEDMLHRARVRVIAFSPFGRFVATGCDDGSVRIWRQDMGATASSLPTTFQHYAAARTAFFSADAKAIITAAEDLTAVRWTRGSMKPTGRPMVHESKVMCAVFSRDRSLMATISEDGQASLWNGETNQRIGDAHNLGAPGRWVDFAPDGKRFMTTAGTKAVIWSVEKGNAIGEPIEHADHANLNTARFSPDGKWIVTASDDKTACVWETESHKLVARLSKHEGAVLNARFSFDGTRLVTAGEDGAIIVWDTATWEQSGKSGVMPGEVYSAVISPDNRFVIATSANANGVGFFHIPSGRLFTQIVELPTDAYSVDLDSKGDAMVVACMDGTVRTYGSPFVQEDIPKWVPDFAERLVGMRKDGTDEFELVDTKYSQLRSDFDKVAADGSDDFAQLARWSLTAGAERTGMPRTRTKIADIVVKRVDERSLQALSECFDADPEDPLIIAALSLLVPTQRQGEFIAEFALSRSQNNPLAQAYVASTFAKYSRMDDAERIMKAALSAAPNDPRVLRRAAKLDTRQNRKQAAIEKLDRAVAADPQDEVTYRDYGWMMYNLNDPAKAIEQFKKADELCGSADTDINAGMALAYAALGDQANSIKRYQRLIKIGNEWGEAEYLKGLQGWTDKELAGMENIRVLAVKP